jgi:predicted thioesterase|tara:strand:- start:1766 stop:2134 length:369 start_codon:yes stop_codon:yes gene_type:complete
MDATTIKPGDSQDVIYQVTKDMTVNRTGKTGNDVLSTPSLLHIMELACIEITDSRLPEGYATVGYAVDKLRHLAPTKIDQTVTISVTITEVDGKKFSYSIGAHEGDKMIGKAEHKRASISTE